MISHTLNYCSYIGDDTATILLFLLYSSTERSIPKYRSRSSTVDISLGDLTVRACPRFVVLLQGIAGQDRAGQRVPCQTSTANERTFHFSLIVHDDDHRCGLRFSAFLFSLFMSSMDVFGGVFCQPTIAMLELFLGCDHLYSSYSSFEGYIWRVIGATRFSFWCY